MEDPAQRPKRTIQDVLSSAALADSFKRAKPDASRPVSAVIAQRDHDEEMIHELEDGRSSGNSRRLILSQYWQIHVVTPMSGGEATSQIRFTSRYRALSAAHKLRLLEATQRDEIAADLLKKSFATLNVGLKLELLRLSPYHKTEISLHILMTQFPVMSDELRMRFLEVAPKNILVTILEKHIERLSVREALTAACNLEDRQYADIRRSTSELIWSRKDICDVEDLVKLGQIVLPRFGRELVAEIKNRSSSSSMRPIAAAPKPSPPPHQSSPLAILFPTSMAQCFIPADDHQICIGHGPLIAIPTFADDDGAFRVDLVVDWASADYGFVHLILTRALGDFIEAVVSVSDGGERLIEVGVVDDDSPSLELPWPLPGLGTPGAITISANLQQSEPDDDEEQMRSATTLDDQDLSSLLDQTDEELSSLVETLVAQGAITETEQMHLEEACRDPRLRSIVDMMVAKATSESRADPTVFMHLLRQCRCLELS